MMKFICEKCGKEIKVKELKHDDHNLEGVHVVCSECGARNDIDFDFNKTFVMDIAKMSDFKVLSKTTFLESYSYVTEEEYEATKLYIDWLKAEN